MFAGSAVTTQTRLVPRRRRPVVPEITQIGVILPPFEYWQIDDPVPAGAVWWDPTNGNNANNGSTKLLAKQSFAAAEAIATTSKRIILAGGEPDSTTYHVVPQIRPTKSGTSATARMELFAEPGRKVVLIEENAFLGALTREWTWTLIDPDLMIWESPDIPGLAGVGATTVVIFEGDGDYTNAVRGFIRCPHGAFGRPHLMALFWYAAAEFVAPATGPNAGRLIKDGGYGGPGLHLPGNGRVRIRMQRVTAAYSGTDWPTDGRWGTCVDPATGLWQEPITENPNDYEIHIMRNSSTGYFFYTNHGWWRISGINGALRTRCFRFGDGSHDNLIDRGTYYHTVVATNNTGSSLNNEMRRCRLLCSSSHSVAREEHKASGNYWTQHGRSVLIHSFDGSTTANTAAGLKFRQCTTSGHFDGARSLFACTGRITFDHCAILLGFDDGFVQTSSHSQISAHASYCYYGGGPVWSGSNGTGANPNDWIWHHCIIDNRFPGLWVPMNAYPSQPFENSGVGPHKLLMIHNATHAGGGFGGPTWVRKICYCTIIGSPDRSGVPVAPSSGGYNLPAGREHEVFNNIICLIDNMRYRVVGDPGRTDSLGTRVACNQPVAGTQRYDYNCYWRNVPTPSSPLFEVWQDSYNAGEENFASLAAFKIDTKYTLSASMYSDGTAGHEEHGVEVDPGFVNTLALDYRPTHASVISGAKNVTALIGGAHQNWKGALDPNGDGTEVGPLDHLDLFGP